MQTYLLLFVAMAAIFYLLILRPQQRPWIPAPAASTPFTR